MDNITYQNPPTDYDITTQTLNHLQDQIDELKTEITTEKKWSADFSNTIFIADDFENYGSWSEEFANKMNITNYRRYYKQGLRFWSGSVNNLKSYVENTILVKETSPADVTAVIICVAIVIAVKNLCGFSIITPFTIVPFCNISSRFIKSQLCKAFCAK